MEWERLSVKFSIIYFPYNNSRYTDIILQSMILLLCILFAALLNVKSHDTVRPTDSDASRRFLHNNANVIPLTCVPLHRYILLFFSSYSLILCIRNTGISSSSVWTTSGDDRVRSVELFYICRILSIFRDRIRSY